MSGPEKPKEKGPTPVTAAAGAKDPTLAILEQKKAPNRLIVDDSASADSSVVTINPRKMEELKMFRGDTVLIKGKKRHDTVCLALHDEACAENKILMNKV